MDEKRLRDFVATVRQLDTQDVWFMARWARQVLDGQPRRQWVIESTKNGTGPLVLGAEPASPS